MQLYGNEKQVTFRVFGVKMLFGLAATLITSIRKVKLLSGALFWKVVWMDCGVKS
jgi:hypothetical protein